MKLIILSLHVAGIVAICFIGTFAALVGLRALDNWCAAQLTDATDE